MRRPAWALLLVCLPMLAGGCMLPRGYQIEKVQNVLLVGLDAEGDQISLTILVDTIEQGGEAGQKKIGQELYMAAGKTVAEAMRTLHEYTDRQVSLYHLQFIMIGEEAARQGIDRYLSFFCEDDETNFLHVLMIARGMTARELLQQTVSSDDQFVDKLNALLYESEKTGESKETELLEYIISRKRSWVDLRIPVVGLLPDPVPQKGNQEEGFLLKMEGYGVFREDALAGFLDGTLAQGVNFITNEIKETSLSVQDANGRDVALEVMKSRAVIKPDYGGPLSAAIRITVKSNLIEYGGDINLTKNENILYLEERENELIRQNVEQALAVIQRCGADVIGLGDAFYRADPVAWREIKDRWGDIFSELDISVEVESKVQCTYVVINAPVGEGE